LGGSAGNRKTHCLWDI